MIIGALLILNLQFANWLFSFLPTATWPQEVWYIFDWIYGPMVLVNQIMPVEDLLKVFGWIITIEGLVITFKLAKLVINLINKSGA